jgi:hypothetical protein
VRRCEKRAGTFFFFPFFLFGCILEDRFRESLRVTFFLPDVKQTGRFFTGAAGDGHVVFILTLPLGLFSFLFLFLLPNVR